MKKLLIMLFVASLCFAPIPQAEAGPLCRIGKAVKKRVKARRAKRGSRRAFARLFGKRCG